MKLTQKKLCWLGVLLVGAALVAPARADEISDKGRALFTKYQHAVVTVQVVLKNKISMAGRAGQSNESRQDVAGTIVNPSGLTVVALSSVDPAQLVQNLMPDDDSRLKVESELTDVKMLLEDGTEVPAEVVLRDKDLDMAFIRPKAKLEKPLPAVDLADAGKAEILDVVISLNRLGNAAGRAYSASVERVAAIVQRPRLFYVPDSNMTTSTVGCPAFTLDGKFLGVFVTRTIKGAGGGSALNMQSGNFTGIILPAEDVRKAAEQAPAVAATAPGDAEKK